MAQSQSLPAMVRAKYPGVYDDLSDDALDAQVRAKYPGVYDDVPKPQPIAQPDTRGAVERFVSPLLPSTTPKDYIEGPLYAMRHPIDSARLIKDAVASDPVGAVPVVGNVKRSIQDVGEGNYAGALGEIVAAAAPLIFKRVRVPVGEGTSAVGRTVQAVAESKPVQRISGMAAAGEMVIKGDYLKALTAAVAPTLAKYTGKGMVAVGDLLKGSEAAVVAAKQADPKISLKALDVVRIKALIDQGVSQSDATKAVLIQRAKGLADIPMEPAPAKPVPKFETKPFVANQNALNEEALARRRAEYRARQGQ